MNKRALSGLHPKPIAPGVCVLSPIRCLYHSDENPSGYVVGRLDDNQNQIRGRFRCFACGCDVAVVVNLATGHIQESDSPPLLPKPPATHNHVHSEVSEEEARLYIKALLELPEYPAILNKTTIVAWGWRSTSPPSLKIPVLLMRCRTGWRTFPPGWNVLVLPPGFTTEELKYRTFTLCHNPAYIVADIPCPEVYPRLFIWPARGCNVKPCAANTAYCAKTLWEGEDPMGR